MNRLKALYESGEPHTFQWHGLTRRQLLGGAVGLLVPLFAKPIPVMAATNFLWSGAGSYNAGPTSWLTTELNSLAVSNANVLSTLGAAFQNTSSWIYADVEMVYGGTATPIAGAFMELWHLRSVDGGTNYEDGSATIAPGRSADVVIPIRAGTTITPRAGMSGLIMPPAFFKPIARNQTTLIGGGATLPASGNVIRASFYVEQF